MGSHQHMLAVLNLAILLGACGATAERITHETLGLDSEDGGARYELHAGLRRAHHFRDWRLGPLAPDVQRPMSELYTDPAAIDTLLENTMSHDVIYESLLADMITKRGGSNGTFQENREAQIAYVKSLFDELICRRPEPKPHVFFVFGGTAVGKSTFVRTVAKLPDRTVHVNADDIRSLLVGNYHVYAKMTGNGRETRLMRFSAQDSAAKDTQQVRLWVQQQVQARRCHFLADSYSAPAFAVNGFVKEHYTARVFYLEMGLAGTRYAKEEPSFDMKVELSRERIRQRIQDGGHASSDASLMPDGFVRDLRLQIAKLALELTVPIQFYLSQERHFDWVGWMAVPPTMVTPPLAGELKQ